MNKCINNLQKNMEKLNEIKQNEKKILKFEFF